jgi:hypothetical protein
MATLYSYIITTRFASQRLDMLNRPGEWTIDRFSVPRERLQISRDLSDIVKDSF